MITLYKDNGFCLIIAYTGVSKGGIIFIFNIGIVNARAFCVITYTPPFQVVMAELEVAAFRSCISILRVGLKHEMDEIVPELFSRGLITEDTFGSTCSIEPVPACKRINYLLHALLNRIRTDSLSFDSILGALNTCGHQTLAEKLREEQRKLKRKRSKRMTFQSGPAAGLEATVSDGCCLSVPASYGGPLGQLASRAERGCLARGPAPGFGGRNLISGRTCTWRIEFSSLPRPLMRLRPPKLWARAARDNIRA